jgi:hypothetical protein
MRWGESPDVVWSGVSRALEYFISGRLNRTNVYGCLQTDPAWRRTCRGAVCPVD